MDEYYRMNQILIAYKIDICILEDWSNFCFGVDCDLVIEKKIEIVLKNYKIIVILARSQLDNT